MERRGNGDSEVRSETRFNVVRAARGIFQILLREPVSSRRSTLPVRRFVARC